MEITVNNPLIKQIRERVIGLLKSKYYTHHTNGIIYTIRVVILHNYN